jgi:hypothetical protein
LENAYRVLIVMGQCARSRQGFGIRIEHAGGHWVGTWAFPMKDAAAKREGYDKTELTGTFAIGPAYPGCPHCKATGWVTCGACSKLACWDGDSHTVVCPWCGNRADVGGEIGRLVAGQDL